MRLWTVRDARELRSASWPLRSSARFADDYMLPAYRWMASELRRRVGPPPRGVELPLWAWLERPDLRTSAHLPRGRRGVLVEVELPRARVLVSDFERFHAVLNRHYLAIGEADDERFERAAARAGKERWPFTPALRRRVERSWRRIFTLSERSRDPRHWGDAAQAPLQAVFWELPREAVRSKQFFIAR